MSESFDEVAPCSLCEHVCEWSRESAFQKLKAERDAWRREAMDRGDRISSLEDELERLKSQSQRRIGELTALVRAYNREHAQ